MDNFERESETLVNVSLKEKEKIILLLSSAKRIILIRYVHLND